jgi:hypothetical protein
LPAGRQAFFPNPLPFCPPAEASAQAGSVSSVPFKKGSDFINKRTRTTKIGCFYF